MAREFTTYILEPGNLGRVTGGGIGGLAAPPLGQQIFEGAFYQTDVYFDFNEDPVAVLPRPLFIEPDIVNRVVSWEGFPPETKVRVTNEEGESLDLTVAQGTLTLTDPGRYSLRVDPPFPMWPVETEVLIE